MGLLHQLPRQLRLGPEPALGLRDGGRLAALRVLHPVLRQVEPGAGQGNAVAAGQGREDAHLAVVQLAEATVVLALHSGGLVALLGEAALVQQEHVVLAAAEDACGPQADPLPQRSSLPWAFGEEVLEVLEPGAGEHLADALDVLAGAMAQEAGDVLVGMLAHVASCDVEEGRDHAAKRLESSCRGMDVERFIFLKAGCRPGRPGRAGLACPTRRGCNG